MFKLTPMVQNLRTTLEKIVYNTLDASQFLKHSIESRAIELKTLLALCQTAKEHFWYWTQGKYYILKNNACSFPTEVQNK